MATTFLSPIGNGDQYFTDDAIPLDSGLLHTYQAGTTTPVDTFQDLDGVVPNLNPIQLDSSGNVPVNIRLTAGDLYKFFLTDKDGVERWTIDDIAGINDIDTNVDVTFPIWVDFGVSPVRVDDNTFSVPGNFGAITNVGRRVRLTQPGGDIYGSILSSAVTQPTAGNFVTTIDLLIDGGLTILTGVTAAAYSAIDSVGSPVPQPTQLTADVALLKTEQAADQIVTTTAGTSTAYTLTIATAGDYTTNQRFAVKFHTASGSNPTIALNANGALALKQYISTGAKIGAIIATGQVADLLYDGTDMMMVNPLPAPPLGRTFFMLAGNNGAAGTQSVFLTQGNWQLTIQGAFLFWPQSNTSFQVTQAANVVGVSGTATWGAHAERSGGSGHGYLPMYSGTRTVTIAVPASATYVLNVAAMTNSLGLTAGGFDTSGNVTPTNLLFVYYNGWTATLTAL